MILYLAFTTLLAVVVIVVIGLRGKGRAVRKGLLITGLVLFIGGTIFGAVATDNLVDATERTYWPSVEGEVLSSEIIGDRAYRPEVKYGYSVGGAEYTGISDLGIPGFGGRKKRLDVAEKTISEYPVGSNVLVFFNPDDPSESMLVHRVSWSLYTQLAVAITLALGGAIMIVFFSYRPRKTQPSEAVEKTEVEK